MIPREAIESYERLAGNQDVAGYRKIDMSHWGKIEFLLSHLQNVDAGHAAESYRLRFEHALAESGISIGELRDLQKVVEEAEADTRKRRSQKPNPWWRFWK